jgi:glycosyltransferase involved in cell wall biosynthesis
MTRRGQVDVLWLTNIATPYTLPVWRELNRLTRLRVACFASTEPDRHWTVGLDGVPLTVLGARPLRVGSERIMYAPSRHLVRLFRERPGTVVIDGWESPISWQARALAALYGVRVVISYWSIPSSHAFSSGPVASARRWFFRTADAVYTPGAAAAEAVSRMGVPAERITMGFGTVDVERFWHGRNGRQDLSSRPGHHVLYVGRLVPCKNLTSLLTAFASTSGSADTLTIVGTGPEEPGLRAEAARLGIADVVTFRGHLDGDELVSAYAAAHTLVLPSHRDVWGLVVNEALAAGLQVVVSDRCGVATAVRGMPGVQVCDVTAASIGMAVASAARSGYEAPDDHPIRMMTPAALARTLHGCLSSGPG